MVMTQIVTALQLMVTDIETHDSYDITSFYRRNRPFKLMKGKSVTTSFYLKRRKVEKLDLVTRLPTYQIWKEHV